MATIAGHQGNVLFAGMYTAHVHAWSADVVCEALEDTAWQLGTGVDNPDLPWRSYISGLKGWSGSYECYLDDTVVPELDDSPHWLRLFVDAATYFEGYAIATGIHPSAPIEGIQSVTIDFQGSLRMGRVGTTTTAAPAATTTTTPP